MSSSSRVKRDQGRLGRFSARLLPEHRPERPPRRILPQPRLTLQVPFGFATFQAPLGGSNGVSSILRAPSATNTPFDTLYQPNLATVLNWSLHSGERGFELGLGLQGAGLFGGAGAGGQLPATFSRHGSFSPGAHRTSISSRSIYSRAWRRRSAATVGSPVLRSACRLGCNGPGLCGRVSGASGSCLPVFGGHQHKSQECAGGSPEPAGCPVVAA